MAGLAVDQIDPADLATLRLGASAKREIDRIRREHPLAFAVLWVPECDVCPHPSSVVSRGSPWHRGMPLVCIEGRLHECPSCGERYQRTSQREAVRRLMDPSVSEADLLGGNRSGKTDAGAQITAAYAEGNEAPAVRRWASINGLDISRIQPGPGRVWAVAQTFGAAREYVRPKLDLYLPGSTRRRSWGADNEAEADLPGGGVVVSKAIEQARGNRQGKNPFEGASIHLAWLDEEPQIRLAVDSIDMRLVDTRGLKLNTMTALSGWTEYLADRLGWYRDGKPPPPGVRLEHLYGEHNPHIDAEELRRRLARRPQAAQRARLRGEIVALEGQVHPEFNRALHVVPAFDPPTEWRRFQAIDFGVRDPFVSTWAAQAPDDVLHVYRLYYQPERTIRHHAQIIHAAEACPACWGDVAFGAREWTERLILARRRQSPCPACRGEQAARRQCGVCQRTGQCATCGGTGRREPAMAHRWADPAGKSDAMTLTTEYAIETTPALHDRRQGYEAIVDRLTPDAEGRPHLVIHDTCSAAIREMEGLTWENGKVAEMAVKGADHFWDTLRYLCLGLVRYGYSRPPPTP